MKTEKYGVHLPTGSCISPALSFLANQPLFDRISELSDSCGCVFTLYVDDITISGQAANAELLNLVATEIFKRGYKYHKINVSDSPNPLITGLIIKNGNLHLPHGRARKIRDLTKLLAISAGAKDKMLASLVGRLSEAEQIEPRYKTLRLRVVSKYAADWSKIVKNRTRKSRIARIRRLAKTRTPTGGNPS